jgi:hypothetical protein
MRLLVVSMAAVLAKVGAARWRTQDEREAAFREALEGHRESTEASFRDFRTEFMGNLDRLRASIETALHALNATMAEVARTAGETRARMAERYATKEDLAALEKRMAERFALCSESCPPSCKP